MNPMLLTLAAGDKPDPMSHVLPHYLFGSEWFTNHHLMSLAAAVLGFILLACVASRIVVRDTTKIESYVTKGRVAQLFETICVFLREQVTRPMLGDLTDKYIYYIWSIFFFILFCNLLGMLPIGAALALATGNDHLSHFGGTVTGNLNFTAGLAIVAFFMIHGIGVREHGLPYFKHFCPVPLKLNLLLPVMLAIAVLMVIIELIGAVIKPFALAVRLFANMVAGHLVLGSLVIMILATGSWLGQGMTLIGAALFSFMELFVAFLQAYIFTFLTVIFISLGAAHHGDHEHEHDEHGHEHEHGVGDVLNEEAARAAH